MSKTCYYCGYTNTDNRKAHPKRCPQCGNPYGFKPQRRLTGRWTR